MKAGLRLGMMAFATGLCLGAPAFAQALPQNTTQNSVQPTRPQSAPTTNTTQPATTVGPRELQNFSLPGTTTKPADQPAQKETQSNDRCTQKTGSVLAPACSKIAFGRHQEEVPSHCFGIDRMPRWIGSRGALARIRTIEIRQFSTKRVRFQHLKSLRNPEGTNKAGGNNNPKFRLKSTACQQKW